MANRLTQLFNLRPGEWKLAVLLLIILAINMIVIELTVVIATAGFVSNAGASQLPWLWIIDMVALLILSGLYATVVDRIKKVTLLSWLFGIFAVTYLVIQLLFVYGAPDTLNYLILYIAADIQFFIVPLAFWTLANDVYRISETKRLFPLIGAGYVIGSIIGNGLAASSAAFFAQFGGENYQLLGLAALLLLIAFVVLYFTFQNRPVHGRQSRDDKVTVRETIEVGVDFFKNVPLFYYLSIVIFLIYFAYTLLQYHFLFTLEQASSDDLQFQTFYGWYKVAVIVATLFIQWLVAGRLLERVGLKNSFMVFPVIMVIASGSALAITGLIGGATAIFLISVTERAWDEPARKSLQGLIPDERRGRVSTFLDSYLLAISTIVACILLLILFAIFNFNQLSSQWLVVTYLVIAGVAGAVAAGAALRARSEYDESMLNWRLSRRGRRGLTGVMKKLDI